MRKKTSRVMPMKVGMTRLRRVRTKRSKVNVPFSRGSGERGSLAQAVDHRSLAHEQIGRLWVLGSAADLVEALATYHRVAFLEKRLVALTLGIDMLDRDGPALARVAIEQRLVGAAPHRRQRVGEVHGIVDAAVEAHAAQRVVEMCRVARQQYAARPIVRRNALMHAIERAVLHLISGLAREEALQQSLGQLGAGQRVLAGLGLDREHDPPET